MNIANLDDAREFAHSGPITHQDWRTAILSASAVEADYLIDHSPYTTLKGVKGAETRAVNKLARLQAEELAEAIPVVRGIVEIHGAMVGSYFWTPRGNRAARDRYAAERTNAVEFTLKGRRFVVSQSTECSAKNIYYSLDVRVDGRKKDIRALRNI